MNNTHTIALAGCGKMGSAMAQTWLSQGIASQLVILDPNPIVATLADDPRVKYYEQENAFAEGLKDCDILVLAIKPQGMDAFCDNLKSHLPKSLPVLSIAAGRMIASFEKHFGSTHPIIRAMPNTPAAIGKGMSVAVASYAVTNTQKEMAEALLSACGKFAWADDESLMDAVTAVSGSGPAYVFYLIEALAKAGEKAGLSADMSMTLARQTVIGSAALAEGSADISASKLRENVTSPGGTTAAALSILMDGQFQKLMDNAVAKATARGKELSQ